MGYRVISFRGESADVQEFKEAMEMAKEGLHMAKKGFDKMRELSDDMSEQYGERGSYGERYSQRGYNGREWDGMDERRGRNGRYM